MRELYRPGAKKNIIDLLIIFSEKGTINCRVTGARRFSGDIQQGFLRFPANSVLKGTANSYIDKTKNLVQYAMKAFNADAAIDEARMIVENGPLVRAHLHGYSLA